MKLTKIYAILLFAIPLLAVPSLLSAQQQGYAIMRVFDCNKAVGMGTGFITAKIMIAYENGKSEEIDLLPYSEKNEIENLKKVTETLNKLKSRGYFLISQTTTGEQGSLLSDYTFLKQGQ